ncbi:MAG: MBL fold metallo-hydrolase [Candidatus Sericytochromatia bacterium]|nr:MBL fold metallo-hydrolase [Candidatus Sericytochromatia bacterium]
MCSERLRQVAPGVRCLLAPNPGRMTGPGTNTWLLGDEAVAVLDPGPADDEHLARILAACGPRGPAAIWLSHAHPDHAAAVPLLAARTGAPLHAFPVPCPRFPIAGLTAPEVPLSGGEELMVDGETWQVLHTPGHASDHLCFYRPSDGGLLTGDVVVGQGTVVVAPPDGDMSDYVQSLERLAALQPRWLWPGHGDPIAAAGEKIAEYLAHRRMREQQVLNLLDTTPTTPAALVATLYRELAAGLHEVACAQVEAHLRKLTREGRALAHASAQWSRAE